MIGHMDCPVAWSIRRLRQLFHDILGTGAADGHPVPADRIPGGLVFHDLPDCLHYLRRFFSAKAGRHPWPGISPVGGKSTSIPCLRPFATVCGSMPKIEAVCTSPPWPRLSDSRPAYKRRCDQRRLGRCAVKSRNERTTPSGSSKRIVLKSWQWI